MILSTQLSHYTYKGTKFVAITYSDGVTYYYPESEPDTEFKSKSLCRKHVNQKAQAI